MRIEIKSRWSAEVLFSIETDNWRIALEAAVKSGANLRGADLHNADLRGADLHNADLHGADLHNADLHGADLGDADLHNADLHNADLRGANLYGANLHGADLYGANLYGADLYGADLGENQVLQILGHKHPLIYLNGKLRIGCHELTIDQWREKADNIGADQRYSPLDIEIYKLHIEHVARCVQLLWPVKATEVTA